LAFLAALTGPSAMAAPWHNLLPWRDLPLRDRIGENVPGIVETAGLTDESVHLAGFLRGSRLRFFHGIFQLLADVLTCDRAKPDAAEARPFL
jgi:hypothetical protein